MTHDSRSPWNGYDGASGSCTSDLFSGPAELSEPEAQNEVWLTEQFDNIRFAMNVHSYGGYFMWPPGAYIDDGRVSLPHATIGEENYFWASSSHILSAVQDWRGTAVWPGRTGPVAVLRCGQLRRRALVQPRHIRMGLRGRRGPVGPG